MYKAIHLSAECFPVAKVGGLGDVVGALPKFLNLAGLKTCVILPRYNQKWNATHTTVPVYHGVLKAEHYNIDYFIKRFVNVDFGFDLFLVDIPELLFRDGVYGYEDDALRFLFFQHAALDWINSWQNKPDIIHSHDHHTGLIPFMINHCFKFDSLKSCRKIFTIHNGLYTGAFPPEYSKYFPDFPFHAYGLLEWEEIINPLAAGIKCCDRLTAVSEGYLDELKFMENSMKWLYNEYWQKGRGIVNGIDTDVWNPVTDTNINYQLNGSLSQFKFENKKIICESVGLNPHDPLLVFIGRLNTEKGGEILVPGIGEFLNRNRGMNFYILGSGANYIEDQIRNLRDYFPSNVANYIGYNESLAHKLYAAADFLIMPSLVEPCGLNQMYAMRYGTIPIVRSVGGLKDTVVDFGDYEGYGIRFNNANTGDIVSSLYRALALYNNRSFLEEIRNRCINLDFSWKTAVNKYIDIYQN